MDKNGWKHTSHFVNDLQEGAFVAIWPDGTRWEGEVRENDWFGKMTIHWPAGNVENVIWENGYYKLHKDVTGNKDDQFYLDGKAHKAIAANWSDYI